MAESSASPERIIMSSASEVAGWLVGWFSAAPRARRAAAPWARLPVSWQSEQSCLEGEQKDDLSYDAMFDLIDEATPESMARVRKSLMKLTIDLLQLYVLLRG